MAFLDFLESRSTSGYKFLILILYADVPCITRYPDGKVEIKDMEVLKQWIAGHSTLLRKYIMELSCYGFLTDVKFGKNVAEFKIRPTLFMGK